MTENIYLTIIEAARISGLDKKNFYNHRDNGFIEIIDVKRGGRRNGGFVERCISFDDMVKVVPAFASLYVSKLQSLYEIDNGLISRSRGFRIIECVRLLDISKQVIHQRIKDRRIVQIACRRNYRKKNEWLILEKDLKKIKSEPIKIGDRILTLFEGVPV